MFYLGHVLAALLGGYLSNKVPMWYLFMGTIVLHIVGYSLYALSITGWMMLVSRVLAGISMGAAISVSFAYLGFSTVKYAENLFLENMMLRSLLKLRDLSSVSLILAQE